MRFILHDKDRVVGSGVRLFGPPRVAVRERTGAVLLFPSMSRVQSRYTSLSIAIHGGDFGGAWLEKFPQKFLDLLPIRFQIEGRRTFGAIFYEETHGEMAQVVLNLPGSLVISDTLSGFSYDFPCYRDLFIPANEHRNKIAPSWYGQPLWRNQ
jgi:hypothetical protein